MNGKRSRSEASVAKVPVDEDLVCAICIDLVNDARQVSCCGSLFCKSCIEQCQRRCGHAVCPNCRTVLISSNILVDKRSERKSADHLRNCMYHEEYHCSFIGNRSAVLKHQTTCEYNPIVCKNEYCRKLHMQESERQQQAVSQESALKKQLIATAWQAPEETLRIVYNLTKVEFFRALNGPVQEYRMAFMWANTYYMCTLSVAHHNVSISCNSAGFLRDQDLKVKCVLIHPSDPLLNRSVEIFVPAAESDADEDDDDYDEAQDEAGSDADGSEASDEIREVEVIDCTSDAEDQQEDDYSDETSATCSDDEEDDDFPVGEVYEGGALAEMEDDEDSEDSEENEDEDGDEENENEEDDEEEEEEEENEVHGEANWMTEREFFTFVKNGKFALGVEASAYG